MSAFTPHTRYAQARRGFTEFDVYREVIPGEPLRAFVTDGPLDAPTWMPAGSMLATRGSRTRPLSSVTSRQEA